LKPSRFGPFVGCENYPECNFRRQLTQSDDDASLDGKLLGYDDQGAAVTLRTGRFGPYVQLGEAEGDEKPKRSSLPKGVDAATLDLGRALQLLSLPREVGTHPETGTPITAGLGRYGPFILHDGTYANLESMEDVFTIGLNRAVTLLAEKRAGGGKSRFQRNAAQVLKDFGEHPTEGGKLQILNGRYGPYVSHNKVYATVPKAKQPEDVTLEEALQLLAERIEKGGGKKPAKKAKAPAKKAVKDDGDGAKAIKAKPPAPRAAAKSAPAKPAAKAAAKKAPPKKSAKA
jgi:DNA topoisomerase-1